MIAFSSPISIPTGTCCLRELTPQHTFACPHPYPCPSQQPRGIRGPSTAPPRVRPVRAREARDPLLESPREAAAGAVLRWVAGGVRLWCL